MTTVRLVGAPDWSVRAQWSRVVALRTYQKPIPHLMTLAVRSTPQDTGQPPVSGPIYSLRRVEVRRDDA